MNNIIHLSHDIYHTTFDELSFDEKYIEKKA